MTFCTVVNTLKFNADSFVSTPLSCGASLLGKEYVNVKFSVVLGKIKVSDFTGTFTLKIKVSSNLGGIDCAEFGIFIYKGNVYSTQEIFEAFGISISGHDTDELIISYNHDGDVKANELLPHNNIWRGHANISGKVLATSVGIFGIETYDKKWDFNNCL